jgi:hypothetical protein
MSSSQIALLGAIAGVTIFLGLPIGRLSNPLPRLKAALNRHRRNPHRRRRLTHRPARPVRAVPCR